MTSSKEKEIDDRAGLKFGADTGGDSDSEYVSALPTDEEERMLLAGENVKAREKIEYLDEGRASNHPSTLAATQKASSAADEVSLLFAVLSSFLSAVGNVCMLHLRGKSLPITNKFSWTGFFLFLPSFCRYSLTAIVQRGSLQGH